MKKRFIICLNSSNKDQDKKFIEFLRENNFGWWHWLSHTWLISNPNGHFTASELRDAVKKIYNGEHNIVFEITDTSDTWAGFGPSSDSKNMFKWLKSNWKKD